MKHEEVLELLETYQKLVQSKPELLKKYNPLIAITHHSCALAGSSLTESETQIVLEEHEKELAAEVEKFNQPIEK